MNVVGQTLSLLFGKLPNLVKDGNLEGISKILDEYKLTEEEIMNAEVEVERELTKRLQADAASDSWLSKSVRPLGFMIWTALMLFIILFDGNIGQFTINKAYLPMIETTYTAFITFYIGSRGIEKAIRVWSNSPKGK